MEARLIFVTHNLSLHQFIFLTQERLTTGIVQLTYMQIKTESIDCEILFLDSMALRSLELILHFDVCFLYKKRFKLWLMVCLYIYTHMILTWEWIILGMAQSHIRMSKTKLQVWRNPLFDFTVLSDAPCNWGVWGTPGLMGRQAETEQDIYRQQQQWP